MYLLPFLAAFALIFLDILTAPNAGWKQSYLKAILVFCTVLVIITETLSAFDALNRTSLVFAWSLVSVAAFLHVRPRLREGWRRLDAAFRAPASIWRQSLPVEKAVMVLLGLLVTLITIQGLVYPVNNSDSLTYHLPRIISWISQGSVEHYPTSIFRQLYQPPFSEFLILHVNLLVGGDGLCNLIQVFFLLSSAVAVMTIMDASSLPRRLRLVSTALVLTLPMALLQASSTKPDIELAFFMLSAMSLTVDGIRYGRARDYGFLGLAFGLAMLTKSTSYIFLTPTLLLLAGNTIVRLVKDRSLLPIRHGLLAASACLLLNLGHFSRNYRLTGNVMGLDERESRLYSNERMSPSYLLSNMMKNIGRQTGPEPLNKYYDRMLLAIHHDLGMPVNDPYTHYENRPYSGAPSQSNYEENAPNFMHLYLFLACLGLFAYHGWKGRGRSRRVTHFLLATVLLQFVIFSAYLKWQPWHSRLLVPVFFVAIAFSCHVIALYRPGRTLSALLVIPFILFGLFIVEDNRTRPLYINRESQREYFRGGRFDRQFMSFDRQTYLDYKAIRQKMRPVKDMRLGLILNQSNVVYTLMRDAYDSGIHPIYLMPDNPSRRIAVRQEQADCIVSNTIRKPGLGFRGSWYVNATPANTRIWLYRRADRTPGH